MSKKLTSKSSKNSPAMALKRAKPATKSMTKAPKKSTTSSELQHLEAMLELMSRHGLGELEVEDASGRVFARKLGAMAMTQAVAAPVEMTRANAAVTAAQAHLPPPSQTPAESAAKKPATGSTSDNQKKVLSPFVGTFYRAASPTSEPYAKEGQTVKKGQTLCIIEAMKLMNEIESEFGGKIVAVLVENGQPVEFGEPLFLIEG